MLVTLVRLHYLMKTKPPDLGLTGTLESLTQFLEPVIEKLLDTVIIFIINSHQAGL